MAQKKRYGRRPSSRLAKRNPRQRRVKENHRLEETILSTLYDAGTSLAITEIKKATGGRKHSDKELAKSLDKLIGDGFLIKLKKRQYKLSNGALLYTGRLTQHPRKFGFVPAKPALAKTIALEHDIFIGQRALSSAVHGDQVLVKLKSSPHSDKPEGSIIAVLERGPDTICGIFKKDGKGGFVYPEDVRIPFIIEVGSRFPEDLQDGYMVMAQFEPPDIADQILPGTVVEVLGSPNNIDVQMRLVIEKHQLPAVFSEKGIKQAEQFPSEIKADEHREDLREILHVTIDGETAKDFDDAIAVERREKGYRLYISIADVSHYVKPGSAIDKDAYERGTSIYFPGRVIPMLPERLSNDLCSLVPHKDRYTLTAILDFNDKGKRIAKKFCRSLIYSHHRFTYTKVQKILEEGALPAEVENRRLLPMLRDAEKLAKLLLEQRNDRGSIGFNLPEPVISLNDDGTIKSIVRFERSFAHQIIEEFMLAANEAVAETFSANKRKAIYRIHELPDRKKVMEFSDFAKTFGLDLPKAELTPQWFGEVLEKCENSPARYVVNNLLLRTMQQARYSFLNKGHFALAAENYTHFTSPIRRYPDLMVHRELCSLIAKKKNGAPSDREDSDEYLSTRERRAIDAEREINDRLKLIYMEKHLGEKFTAIISGVTDFAFFVELTDTFISGSVPIEDLNDDYYLFDGKQHRLIGEINGRIFQIGDEIEAIASRVEKNKRRIIFKPTLSK